MRTHDEITAKIEELERRAAAIWQEYEDFLEARFVSLRTRIEPGQTVSNLWDDRMKLDDLAEQHALVMEQLRVLRWVAGGAPW